MSSKSPNRIHIPKTCVDFGKKYTCQDIVLDGAMYLRHGRTRL
jgi:hypothetical protein